jgi:hypothetical protein
MSWHAPYSRTGELKLAWLIDAAPTDEGWTPEQSNVRRSVGCAPLQLGLRVLCPPGTLSVGALLARSGSGRCTCMHVGVEQTVGGGAQYAGAHCKGRVDRATGSSPRHAPGRNVTAGTARAWALHCTPHRARMAQAPRSLCHKLTYPLLQRDRSVPRSLGAGCWRGAGPCCQAMSAPPGGGGMVLGPVEAACHRREEAACPSAEMKSSVRRGVAEACYIHVVACCAPVALEPWIAHVSGRTQPPLRVMIGFGGVIRLAAITSARPISAAAPCAPAVLVSRALVPVPSGPLRGWTALDMQARLSLRREGNQQRAVRLGAAPLATSIRHEPASLVESPKSTASFRDVQQMGRPHPQRLVVPVTLFSSTWSRDGPRRARRPILSTYSVPSAPLSAVD